MRLFIALDLPEPLEATLFEVIRTIDPEGRGGRWSGAGVLHLTLKFLGEVDSSRLEGLVQALDRVRAAAFEVIVSGIGFFPSRRSPRVLWAGVRSTGLKALHAEIEMRAVEAGFGRDERTFQGHVTLGRARGKGRMGGTVLGRLGPYENKEFGQFTATRFVLYRSHLGTGGAVHEKQAEFVFAR